MVTDDRCLAALSDKSETLCRSGSITDDVSEAEDLGDPLLVDVAEDGLEGIDVGVNI